MMRISRKSGKINSLKICICSFIYLNLALMNDVLMMLVYFLFSDVVL